MRGQFTAALRARQRLGKYRIEKRLSEGGFAVVYQAFDTIEGQHVALKIPHAHQVNEDLLKDFRKEARIAAKLEHPNILPLKDASIIDDYFVISMPLGERTLSDRLQKRLSIDSSLFFAEQMLDGLAYAHQQKIIHCDVKPENMVLFPENRLRLADFGIAKVAMKTVRGSGTGTVGYMAPEQAMGKPSPSSDVFSAGLIIYRMFAGEWPEWPYEWPLAGIKKLRANVPAEFIAFLKKSIDPHPRNRYRDCEQMSNAFMRLKPRVQSDVQRRRAKAA